MSFLDHLKNETNFTTTENGAIAHKTTNSDLLDLFARIGAMRNASEHEIELAFNCALREDKLLATKMLFYARDIRGGLGERRLFRVALKALAYTYPDVVAKNIHLIPEYGRWDDVLVLYDTPVDQDAKNLIKKQWIADIEAKYPSLMAKWLPSETASSAETKHLARKTYKALGLTPRQYRKSLSMLRKKIKIVEALMSANKWSEIEYGKLPSKAGMIYTNAFIRHDAERYTEYLAALKSGQAKINASTLYPYEIVEKIWTECDIEYNSYGRRNYNYASELRNPIYDELWNALPDYYNGKTENALVVADTSGSMYGRPICIAISLAIYAAERNKGQFNNHFITFSERPELQKIIGNTIGEKVANLAKANWNMNTNIKAVFDLILQTAINNGLDQSEMPEKIYIVSDLEFDRCAMNSSKTLFENIKTQYAEHGYIMPTLIFWNVNSRNKHFQFTMNEEGVIMVSGSSATIFSNLLAHTAKTPYEFMLSVLNSPRYDAVTV